MREFSAALALACAIALGTLGAFGLPHQPAFVPYHPRGEAVLDVLAMLPPPSIMPVYAEPLLPLPMLTGEGWHRPRGTAVKPASQRLLLEAARSLGKGPRELGVRSSLWCADAINAWLKRIGEKGTGSALAVSFKSWGKPAKASGGVVGLMPRRGGSGHVVVVDKVKGGKVYAYSPNGGRNKVRYATYPLKRFVAFRAPA